MRWMSLKSQKSIKEDDTQKEVTRSSSSSSFFFLVRICIRDDARYCGCFWWLYLVLEKLNNYFVFVFFSLLSTQMHQLSVRMFHFFLRIHVLSESPIITKEERKKNDDRLFKFVKPAPKFNENQSQLIIISLFFSQWKYNRLLHF